MHFFKASGDGWPAIGSATVFLPSATEKKDPVQLPGRSLLQPLQTRSASFT
jgi:hypothetical protein